MGFGAAVKKCFSDFATFEGRSRRAEYWMFYLFLQIVSFAGFIVVMIVGVFTGIFMGRQSEPSVEALIPYFIALGLLVIVGLVLTIPFLAVSARRLHDMGQSGHWLWLSLVGLSIVPVIMAFFDSEWGRNRWGDDPKAAERAMQGYPQPGYAQQQYGQQQYGYTQPQYGQPQQPGYTQPQQYGQPAAQVDPSQPSAHPPHPPTQ